MDDRYFLKLLFCFAEEFEELEQRITDLKREAIPGLSSELIEEWEADLGLPDTCSSQSYTLEERQAIAHAKYTGKYDGQGKQFYIDYAEKLGATISVKEYSGVSSIFRVDKNRVDRTAPDGIDGSRLWSTQAKFKWLITVYNYGEVSSAYLRCRLNQLKPAHTEFIFT